MIGLVETTRQLEHATAADAAVLSDGELCAAAVGLERVRALVDAAEAKVLAELQVREVCDQQFGLKTPGWLAREAMLPAGLAKKRVQVADKLRSHLDGVAQALLEGRIGWEHARVLADACNPRVVDAVSEIQVELVGLAQGMVFDAWKRQVVGIVDLLDQDGGHDPNGDLAANKLNVTKTFDGVTHLAGTLVGEHALYVAQAVEAKADELFRRFANDHKVCADIEVPTRPVLRALALAELCRQAQGVDVNATQDRAPM